MKRTYLTAQRLAALEASLSDRQRQIVDDVGRVRLATGAQLGRLHFGGTESARRLCRQEMGRLVEARLLLRTGRRIGGVRAGSDGYVYALDVAGRRLLFPDRRRWWSTPTPGELFMHHVLAVTDLYVELQLAQGGGGFELVAFEAEPACWRHFPGAGGGQAVVKPDAFIVTGSGGYEDHVFVEVDLATETRPRITAKAGRYVDYFVSGQHQARSGVFPQVLWLVPDLRRAAQVAEALARLDAEYWRLFAVEIMAKSLAAVTGQSSPGPVEASS